MFKKLQRVYLAPSYSGFDFDYKAEVAHLLQPNRVLVAEYDGEYCCWEVFEVI